MAAAQEISIVTAIIRWINSKPGCHAEKTQGSMYKSGQADVSACCFGRRVEIEVKRPGYEPTKLQQATLDRWAKAGALTGCCHSLAEAKELLRDIIKN